MLERHGKQQNCQCRKTCDFVHCTAAATAAAALMINKQSVAMMCGMKHGCLSHAADSRLSTQPPPKANPNAS